MSCSRHCRAVQLSRFGSGQRRACIMNVQYVTVGKSRAIRLHIRVEALEWRRQCVTDRTPTQAAVFAPVVQHGTTLPDCVATATKKPCLCAPHWPGQDGCASVDRLTRCKPSWPTGQILRQRMRWVRVFCWHVCKATHGASEQGGGRTRAPSS